MNLQNPYNPMNGGLIQEESYSLLDAISVLFRHKWKIAFFFLFMVTASVAAALLLPKTYESYAKILIRLGRENMAVDPGVVGPALQLVQDRENQVKQCVTKHIQTPVQQSIDCVHVGITYKVGGLNYLHRPVG